MKITSLVLNALIFLCILVGTIYVLIIKPESINSSQLAQIETAWPLGIAGLVMAITDAFALKKKDHKLAGFPVWLKFITTSAIFFLVVYLIVMTTLVNPEADIGYPSLISLVTTPYGLTIIVIPFLLSFVSFVFIEKGRALSYKLFWTAILIPVVYGILIIVLNSFGILETPIFFLQAATWKEGWTTNLLYVGVILVSLMVLGILLLIFHNIGIKGKIASLDETINELAEEGESPEITKEKISPLKIIHINPVDKKWQLVCSDTGMIMIFDSQVEAIKEACRLAKETPYSIRVHVGKGK